MDHGEAISVHPSDSTLAGRRGNYSNQEHARGERPHLSGRTARRRRLQGASKNGNQDRDRLSNGFVGRVPEDLFGASIPRRNDASQVLADNAVVRGFDDRCEAQSWIWCRG